nr:cardiolipin synthase [Oleiagrimonas sp. C23AA]
MLTLAGVAVTLHLLGLLAAVHAVIYTRTPQGAVGWAVALVSLPYLTLIPYLFLGHSRFHGYIVAHRRRRARWRDGQGRPSSHTTHGPPHANCQRLDALARLMGRPFRPGHALKLLENGRTTFDAILADIARAEHYVLAQFFIIHDDAIGTEFADALIQRARAGVAVHVLYDGIGSHDLPSRYIGRLRAAGVKIHAFATRTFTNRFQLNFRNHRKIVVVDGDCGYVGGHNVGDEYLGDKPPLSPWRDTHLRIAGPAVDELQRSFAEDWYWVTGTALTLRAPRSNEGGASCLALSCGPADRFETCSLAFVALINSARKRLWLTTPYLVPDNAVMSALRLAVLRGVEVRLLLPARPDHRIVFAVSSLYAHEAIGAGIAVYRYRAGFMHQKVALIDDDTALVGSMNLDNRSFRLNFEIGVLTVDEDFAARTEAMLARDFARARRVTPSDYARIAALRRVGMHVARLFDPIL